MEASAAANARPKELDVAGEISIVWRGCRARAHARCHRPMLMRRNSDSREKTGIVINVILEISKRDGHTHAT
jgi:hypothetical protein